MKVHDNFKFVMLFMLYKFNSAHIRIDGPEVHLESVEYPSFLRHAVESIPRDDSEEVSSRISLRPHYGDMFLPLRSAVESAPSINVRRAEGLRESIYSTVRSFVRDSVESYPNDEWDFEIDNQELENDENKILPYNTPHNDTQVESDQWSVSNKYAAFLTLSNTDQYQPQPYRADSPFQQMLKTSEVENKFNENIDQTDINNGQLKNHGALSVAASYNLDQVPYGALAHFKQAIRKKHVICYFTNWSFYRQTDGKFVPEQLDPKLCTILIYSFAALDPDHLVIKEFDPWVDVDNQFYKRAVESGIPVLIALGGWTDSAGDKYTRLVADDKSRRSFASNVAGFIQRNGFAGLHFDWNYPVCWQSDCARGPAEDKPNLTKLLSRVREEFDRVNKNLRLGVAISGYKEIITKAYDFVEISNIVDFITVMSYDYHGSWERQTGHVSPLYGRKGDKYPQYNTDYTMQLILKLGARRDKLIMGIPLYGQSFTLERESFKLVSEGVPSIGPGEPGEFTKQPGMLAYYEICQRIRKNKWLTGRDSEQKSGPYAMWRNQWVGYEDPVSVAEKTRYALENGFGGVVAWTVDLDDFQNRCCSESFPLLKSINRVLGHLQTSPPSHVNCERPPPPVTPIPPEVTTVSSDGSASNFQHQHSTTTSSTSTTASTSTTTQRTTRNPWWTQKPHTTTRKPTQTTISSAQTTIPSTTIVRPVVQTSKCDIGQYYADNYNCNAYYQCVSATELRLQYCPGGLHWNRKNKYCDWPFTANCQAEKPLKPPTTTKPHQHITSKPTPSQSQKPIQTQRPKPPLSARCNEGEYYSHKNCGQYYICVNGKLVPNSCGANLHWDAIRKICDWPQNVKCVTTRQYLRIAQLRNSLDDPCNGGERVAYPGDCSKYLFCLWNRFQEASCAPGLHFSVSTSSCDWPTSAKCQEVSNFVEPVVSSEITGIKPQKVPSKTTTPPPMPTYPTNKPDFEPLNGYYKVVCYFTNWAWYRKGLGRYTPDDIITNLCTHIVYGFAVLDYSELVLRTHDSWADIDNNFYTRVSALRSKGVKVSLALGGWNDSLGDKYSRLVRNPVARARFIKHAIEFLEKYGFEGLDLDWEYPVCWQTDCNKGMPDEKDGFTALVRELSEAFKPRDFLLSTAVSPSKKIIDAGYDVTKLSKYFDWIAVMTYDFHGQWDKRTGHVAPLFEHPDDEFYYFNANYSIHYWIEKGAPSRKIVMGIPLYGQSFTLENPKNHGLNAKAPAPGRAGEYTRAAGFLAYYEICDRVNHQEWQVVRDPAGRMGPYAYKDSQWVSYDDAAMVRKKSEMIRALNLGGGMVWALDLDDFRNRCGEGVHPLLTQVHNVLKAPPQSYEPQPGLTLVESEVHAENASAAPPIDPLETQSLQPEFTIDPNNEVEEVISEGAQEEIDEPEFTSNNFKVVCYFTNWAWYRQGNGKYLPEDIDAELCTHIVYGFAVLNRETLTIQPHDTWADIDNKFYERVVAYKAKGLKVTVAIGGWNDSAGDKYARLVRNEKARSIFVRNVIEFIKKYGFDGLDLDWEYPVCWQVDCKKGTPDEKDGFTALVNELSQAFKLNNLLLSSAVSPNKKVIDAGYDVTRLSELFDWIAVMTYDYHGQWDKKTGHVAPMYDHPEGTATFNANFSINYWIQKGADRKKLIMGMPMYGQSFTLAQANEHNLNAPTYGGGEAGEATRARGFLAYYEICDYIKHRAWNVVRDPRGRMGPYAYKRDQWVSFDDAAMIKHKSEYVRAMGLGGAMIWALDLDDFQNRCDCESYSLLKTINRVLRNYPPQETTCKLDEIGHTIIAGQDNRPEPQVDTTKPLVVKENEKGMACNGQSYLKHPTDCNKYFICPYDIALEQRCPNGLHWNNNHCDWPQNSKCIERNELTTQYPLVARPKPTSSMQNKPSKKPISPPNKKPTFKPNPSNTSVSTSTIAKYDYKVVCYFTNWAWYRPSEGKYLPEDIDENLCTHIVYGFAVLNSNTLTIKTHDSWADIDNHFYERVSAYKAKGLRVTVAIGGWNDSLGNKYARLVMDPVARSRFIKSVLDFLDKYGFEGLDLDWEYPVCWQVDCSKGSAAEKSAFVNLVKELSQAFKPRKFLLSAAVSPSKKVIDAGYAVSDLAKYFDWIAVMAYDFHGHWDKQTGHVAPFYYVEGDTNKYFNGNFSLNYWIQQGAPAKKIIMGMPLYGQSFSLANTKNHGLKAETIGPGRAGTYTRAGGFLAYYEICEQISQGGWTVIRDKQHRIGPYAFKGDQWVSYDDVADIRRKSDFIKKLGLGGGMVWALDLDDFRGRCGCGKHPLLRTISQELLQIPGQRANDCT